MSQKDQKFIDMEISHRRVSLIDGTRPRVDTKAIVGFCHNLIHKGYVTVTLLQKHECISKKCPYLEKFDAYPFWAKYEAREKQKACIKKAKKKRLLNEKIQKEKAAHIMDNLKCTVQNLADKMELRIIITSVSYDKESENKTDYIIYYVSENSYNDWYKYIDLSVVMKSCHGGKYILRHVKLPNGNYATVSDWKNRKD